MAEVPTSKIGNKCIIHANSVIGSDGFGFATNKLGEHKKIYQNGNVVLEDDVEIGSNTTLDRAVFGTTLIKKGVRMDNLVQVGHNCEIGEYSVIGAGATVTKKIPSYSLAVGSPAKVIKKYNKKSQEWEPSQ